MPAIYDWSDLSELYLEQRLSSIKIAKLKGCCDSVVSYHLRHQGIPTRTRSEANMVFNWSDLRELYMDRELSINNIATIKRCSTHHVSVMLKKLNIETRSISEGQILAYKTGRRQSHKGELNPCWKGGRKRHSGGYILIYKPDHTRAVANYVLEHILVWEEVNNESVPKGWEVHHLNGIPDDNRPENLEAMPSKKHKLILAAKARRIRALEAKVKLLERSIEDNQMIFTISEN